MDSRASQCASGTGSFPRTRWTLVIQAASADEASAHQALDEICRTYWYPIYAFLRRSGHKAEDAEDLTQGFFAELVAGDMLAAASSERGRLRTFLLASLKRFLSRAWRHARAQKRGGAASTFSLDQDQAELRYAKELIESNSPDVLFDRAWALDLVTRVKGALNRHYLSTGKNYLFEALNGFLSWDKGNAAYRDAAARLRMTEANLRTNVYRMRRRYREMLEQEIADTVETAEQAREELQHLLEVLGVR